MARLAASAVASIETGSRLVSIECEFLSRDRTHPEHHNFGRNLKTFDQSKQQQAKLRRMWRKEAERL